MFVFIQVGDLSLSFQVGDCEGYLDMTSTRVSTPSTSGTTSKSSTRYKIKTFNFKSNVDHCGQVKDSVKELSKLLSSLLHSQSKVLIFTTTKNPTTFVFFSHSGTNYNSSSRTGRAIYWSNYKIMNPSGNPLNLPEMMKLTGAEMREGELPLISISERALATKVCRQPYCRIQIVTPPPLKKL